MRKRERQKEANGEPKGKTRNRSKGKTRMDGSNKEVSVKEQNKQINENKGEGKM